MPHEGSAQAEESSLFIHEDLEAVLTSRRIRQITSIQVRNLTPFPVRDAFTSALSQPTDQTQPVVVSVTDDLGVVSPRRRTRKVSSNSTATRSSLKWDEIFQEEEASNPPAGIIRGRKSSGSRVDFYGGGSLGSSFSHAGDPYSPIQSPLTAKSHLPRTNSKASSTSSRLLGSSLSTSNILGSSSVMSLPLSALLPDNSQRGLEKVIGSRLVETCLVITIPTQHHVNYPSQTSASVNHSLPLELESRPTPKSAPTTKSHFRLLPPSKQGSALDIPKHSRGSTSDSLRSGLGSAASDAQSSRSDQGNMRQTKVSSGKSHTVSPKVRSKLSNPAELSTRPQETVVYRHFTPVHRPSTNPFFTTGSEPRNDSLKWNDFNGQHFKVEILGAMPADHLLDIHPGGRDELGSLPYPNNSGFRWKILDEWDIDLQALIPLPDDLTAHPSQLPSNTLLIELSPNRRLYTLPLPSHISSRSPSPSVGYSSDPESALRRVKQAGGQSASVSTSSFTVGIAPLSRRRRRRGVDSLNDSRDCAKTASWPDIFQLVTIQACIIDNDASLSKIIRNIDKVVEDDRISPLVKRDVSEHESRIAELVQNQQKVLDSCTRKKAEIQSRAQQLKKRKDLLALARYQSRKSFIVDDEIKGGVESANSHLSVLRTALNSLRISLLSTLVDIFPIELYSPPDLLFTILDVPLPIPMSNNDPAPPLSLPEHKHINEETIATALGYVAQVLQLLAAYLGKGLVYPVTCIGSRSLIRDGISAMVGPRMFPLFSKGVDTYRFEYGVFLLNKDIEILMVEKELRALDMRHTLPNLKNLLLTLSHNRDKVGGSQLLKRKISEPESHISSIVGLESPTTETLSEEFNMSSSKSSTDADHTNETQTPPASGSTTPIVTNDDSRRSRPFLALSPFADFLRGRYPSSSRGTSKGALEPAEISQARDEEDDRSTIHGVVLDVDPEERPENESLHCKEEPISSTSISEQASEPKALEGNRGGSPPTVTFNNLPASLHI